MAMPEVEPMEAFGNWLEHEEMLDPASSEADVMDLVSDYCATFKTLELEI